jgi:hypothetical protein
MARQTFPDLGRFFIILIYTQWVGLLGREIRPSQGRCLHTEQHKRRITVHRHQYLEWDSNPRSQCSSERRLHALDRTATVIGGDKTRYIIYLITMYRLSVIFTLRPTLPIIPVNREHDDSHIRHGFRHEEARATTVEVWTLAIQCLNNQVITNSSQETSND